MNQTNSLKLNKEINEKEYQDKNRQLLDDLHKSELHRNMPFINADGIIDYNEWLKAKTRILFILKEAYHSVDYINKNKDYNLADDLKTNGPWNGIWNNISNWIYAIINTTTDYLADYNDIFEMI